MSSRPPTMLLVLLTGPGAVSVSTMALWENEGRFNYYEAAREAAVVESVAAVAPGDAISYTSALDTTIPIAGRYVESIEGYLTVRRFAEIYAWSESEDSDGNTTTYLGWGSTVEPIGLNAGISQSLSSGTLSPPRYQIGELEISPRSLHLVDPYEVVPPATLELSATGRSYDLEPEDDYFYARQTAGETSEGDERLQYIGIPVEDEATYFGAISDGVGAGKQYEQNEGFVSALIQNDGRLHHLAVGDRDRALASVRFDYRMVKWLVRVVGTFAMVFGFWVLFARFASVFDSVRWLRGLVRVGVLALGLIVGLSFAMAVIGSSIAVHSPLTAAIPMMLAVAGAVYLFRASGAVGEMARAKRDRLLRARNDRHREKRRAQEEILAGLDEGERAAQLVEWEIEETFTRLAAVARVEGGLDEMEERFLTEWGRRNGVTAYRMKELIRASKKVEPRAEDREDLELLVFMALADGVLSDKEYTALKGVGRKLGVSETELKKIIASVEAEPVPARVGG